jgi:oligosaccharide repeat unit polymerase
MHATSSSRIVTHGLMPLYIASLACVFGIFVFAGFEWTVPIYLTLGYTALLFALLTVTHLWTDWLNPLCLILFIGFLRFSLTGFLLLFGAEPGNPIFELMRLDANHWLLGHSLAVLGLLGVVIGWFFPARLPRFARILTRLRTRLSGAVIYAGSAGMLLGFLALIIFVWSNAAGVEVVYTGAFRGTEIREGTGKFFHFSLLLIASSVVLSAYLIRTNCSWRVALLPVTIAMMVFWVLGGRVRSFAPLAAGLIVLWYRRSALKVSFKTLLIGVSIVPLLVLFLFAGQVYRGGSGIKGIVEELSVTALLEYIQYSVWVDLGQLHSLAGAIAVGPGLLGGQTFSYNLLWPLSDFLNLSGRSGGVFVVEELIGFVSSKWGFHTTLIGDAYLNFGTLAVFVVTAIFGMILRILYAEFRRGRVDPVYYSLALIYSIRIFFESIEKFGEGLTVLVFAFCVIKLSQTLFNIGPDRGWANPTFVPPSLRR